MDYRKLFLWAILGCFSLSLVHAQPTTIFTDAYSAQKRADELFELGVYPKAKTEYEKVLEMLRPAQAPEMEMLRKKAELGQARAAVRQKLPEGEKLMLDFIRTHAPDPLANQALVEVADYYFNDRKYDQAITYYQMIPTYQLTGDQRTEVKFKLGYCLFVRKQFAQAKKQFGQIREINKDYYFQSNYYYGLCDFFLGNYSAAISSFRLVEKSRRYKPHIPYYIAQIYFAQGEYDLLVDYLEPKVNDNDLQKRKELHQLLGQAYFELGNYEEAVPNLEYYAERSGRLTEEEFYQLGFAQYKTGKYTGAVRNFEQLSDVDSELGQYAMFYLADSYLKVGNKTSARNALLRAKRMPFDSDLSAEANFSYAKLSYELGYDRAAINALQEVEKGSKYYFEGQSLMSDIFLKTADYERAIAIIESNPTRTPQMREAYQKVNYYRGLQLYREGRYDAALGYFTKSNSEPVDATIKAASIYWQGDIAHRKKQYNESIRLMNQFLTVAKGQKNLPDESSVYTANYTQGYNYLKKDNHATALNFFEEAIASINRNKPYIRSSFIKDQILGDATLRAGDCHFKRNDYNDAIRFYDEAIEKRYSGYIYALFQKAIIEGLRGNTTDKILALENIVDEYPNSAYADDALYSLGVTYQDISQLSQAMYPLKRLVSDYRNSSDLVVQSLLRLGLISFNQGNLQTSIEYYKQVFANNPEAIESKDALTALEEIYVDYLSDPDGYTRFLETIPGYKVDNFAKDSLNYQAAETQFENGNYSRATTAFTDYIIKFPNGRSLLPAHFHRGESFFQLKQYSKALEDFEFVVNRGQSRYYAKALELAALIAYNDTQDFEKAYDLYEKLEKASQTEEMRFEAQLGAMRSAYRINNTDAVFAMAKKVSNNPSASVQQKAQANFYLGKVAFDNNDYGAAMNAFQQVTTMVNDEDAAEARYLMAEIHYKGRNLTRAEAACETAIQQNSAYPYWVAKTMLLLADVYADMGDLFNARAVLAGLVEGYQGDQALIDEAERKLEVYNRQAQEGSRIGEKSDEFEFEGEN
jgi:tetratricopeptide (TPR) repeat protein